MGKGTRPHNIPYTSLVNNLAFYPYYRALMKQRASRKDRMVKTRAEVDKIHSVIWKVVSDLYKETKGGVYIDNFGYLCHMASLERKWRYHKNGDLIRSKTNGRKYHHILIDFKGRRQYYHLHNNLTQLLTKEMNILIPKKRYDFLIKEIKSYRRCRKPRKLLSLRKKIFCSKSPGSKG